MLDVIISNGTIIDGTGRARQAGDVGVKDGKIVAVGGTITVDASARIDATGLVVTPGFVDHHTHYDGQVTWDDLLAPSSEHGVTTVVVGNCGVGFAPVRSGRHQELIELMESVEDIPGTALSEGIQWAWESFPEYLDVLDAKRWSMDVATMVPHSAVRVYVMGERGALNENATADDIAEMSRLVRAGIEAGALGFSTSRTLGHRTRQGDPIPGTSAGADELLGIVRAMQKADDRAMLELAQLGSGGETGLDATLTEFDLMARLSLETGANVTYLLMQVTSAPHLWRDLLERTEQVRAQGGRLVPQVAGRPFGMLLGFPVYHPFQKRPTFVELASSSSSPEQLAQRLRDPAVRQAILAEGDTVDTGKNYDRLASFFRKSVHGIFDLGTPPDYEPTLESSVAQMASRLGRDPLELMYELLLQDDAQNLLMLPLFNYAEFSHDALFEMISHDATVLGLNDGGAHCAMICDASTPTYMLSHWARDRSRGHRFSLETIVKKLTKDSAELFGLTDRGTIECGKRADLNVFDPLTVGLERPRVCDDLPAGGRRLLQGAHGYAMTMVAGQVTRRNGADTGSRPGRLVRSRK